MMAKVFAAFCFLVVGSLAKVETTHTLNLDFVCSDQFRWDWGRRICFNTITEEPSIKKAKTEFQCIMLATDTDNCYFAPEPNFVEDNSWGISGAILLLVIAFFLTLGGCCWCKIREKCLFKPKA